MREIHSGRRVLVKAAALCAAILLQAAGGAYGATITVTGTGDTVAADGSVTLREAITSLEAGFDANADVAAEVTGSYGTNDAIVFEPAVTGILTVGSSLPPITQPLAITGPGAETLTISGGDASALFFVDGGAATVAISGLTLASGASRGGDGGVAGTGGGGGAAAGMGGALFVDSGDVQLTDVDFIDNAATGGTGGSASDIGDFYGGGGGGYGEDGFPSGFGGGFGGPGGDGGPFGNTGGAGGTTGFGGGGTAGGDGGGGGGGGTGAATSAGGGGFAGGGGGAGSASCGAGPSGAGGFGGGGGGGTGGFSVSATPCPAVALGGDGGNFGGDGGDGVNTAPSGNTVVGGGGGGGAGLGGALFVRDGTVTLRRVSFLDNTATGGSGGTVSTNFGVPGNTGEPGLGKGGAIFVGNGATIDLVCSVTFGGNGASDAGATASDNFNYFLDGTGSLDPQSVSILITAPAMTGAAVGTPYSESFTASGGTGPYTFSLASGMLPSGLTLAPDGTLSGTPTQGGSFPITVQAIDSDGCLGATETVTLVVSCPAISVTPPAVTGGPAGAVFSESFTVSGGTAPHAMALASGLLPSGLSLAANGTLSGTPTETGLFPITVEATDAFACAGTSPSYNLAIGCPTITVAPPATTTATAGIPFSDTFTASGGIGTTTFALGSGTLPSGLTLANDGSLSGTPTAAGNYSFSVTATDSNSCNATSPVYDLAVGCPTITVTPPATTTATAGTPYSDTFTASGGVGTTTFAVTSGALPDGLALAADGTLSGTPTVSGSYAFTVTATDDNECSGTSSSFDLSVAAGAPAGLIVSGGSGQQTPVGTDFSVPLQVTVTDGDGNPVPDTLVTFTAVPGITGASASLSGGTMTTDSFGQASVVATANGTGGSHTIEATVGPLPPAVFALANVSGVAAPVPVPGVGSIGLGLLILLIAAAALLLLMRRFG